MSTVVSTHFTRAHSPELFTKSISTTGAILDQRAAVQVSHQARALLCERPKVIPVLTLGQYDKQFHFRIRDLAGHKDTHGPRVRERIPKWTALHEAKILIVQFEGHG